MQRYVYLLLILLTAVFLSCKNQRNASRETVIIDDAAISAIKDTAKNHLINLITIIKINGAANKDFIYSVKYRNSHGNHQWANVFQMQNDSFRCIVLNSTTKHAIVKARDTIRLSQNAIEDWAVEDKSRGSKFGNYTQEYIKARQ